MKSLRDPLLIAIVGIAAIYAAFANQYYLFLLTTGALTVIVGVGLNVLIGLTGQVSFGHVGFYALGAGGRCPSARCFAPRSEPCSGSSRCAFADLISPW